MWIEHDIRSGYIWLQKMAQMKASQTKLWSGNKMACSMSIGLHEMCFWFSSADRISLNFHMISMHPVSTGQQATEAHIF